MKEKMFKNLSLKILSAIFAVVLWTVIVNVYDPTTSYTFSNVSVQLINTESLTDKNCRGWQDISICKWTEEYCY